MSDVSQLQKKIEPTAMPAVRATGGYITPLPELRLYIDARIDSFNE
jgi:hypothetical protein